MGVVTDEEALTVLSLARRVARRIGRQAKCRWMAEDLEGAAVEAAVYALRKQRQLRDLTGYLYQVCRRAAVKAHCAHKEPPVEWPRRDGDDLEAVPMWVDLEAVLRSELPLVRRIVELRLDGRSQHSIAKALGVSQSMVQRRLAQLRTRI